MFKVASGLCVTYTDFGETKRICAHAGNSSCAIVSDLTFEEAAAGRRVRRGHSGSHGLLDLSGGRRPVAGRDDLLR